MSGVDTLAGVARVFYAHGSPRILTAILVGCFGARALLGPPSWGDAVAILAVVAFWPLQEWLIHVFILHYRPRQIFGRTLDFEVPRLHRAHHRDPWRAELVFVPSSVFVYAPWLLIGLAFWLLPTAAVAASALVAYFALALHYEWFHCLVHTRYRPRSAWYQRLWRNHRLHHFKNEHYWFGVTMLSGDRILGTSPSGASVARSPTALTLGGDSGSTEIGMTEIGTTGIGTTGIGTTGIGTTGIGRADGESEP